MLGGTMSRIGHSGRPLVCPECAYNLVGTVAAGRTTCPECGRDFKLTDLPRARLPGEWTPWVGLRRALLTVLWRSIVCLPIWALAVWAVIPALNLMPFALAVLAVVGLVLALPGVAIGHALGRGLTERAGFVSPLVTAIPVVFACAVIIGGVELADQFRAIQSWRATYVEVTTGLFAMLWIVKVTLLEE